MPTALTRNVGVGVALGVGKEPVSVGDGGEAVAFGAAVGPQASSAMAKITTPRTSSMVDHEPVLAARPNRRVHDSQYGCSRTLEG